MYRFFVQYIGFSIICFGLLGLEWSAPSEAKPRRKFTKRKGVSKSRLPGYKGKKKRKKKNKNKPCRYKGKTYKNGQKYRSMYGCDNCTCYSGKMKCRKNARGCAKERKCRAVAAAKRAADSATRRAKSAIRRYKSAERAAKSAIARYKRAKFVLRRTPKNSARYKRVRNAYNKAKSKAQRAASVVNRLRKSLKPTLNRAKAALQKYIRLAKATRCRNCKPGRFCTSFYTTPAARRVYVEINVMFKRWRGNPRGFEIDM